MASQYPYDPANNEMIRKVMKAPMLERDEEFALARRWHDKQDERALKQLTRSYLRLVISMTKRFKHYGLPVADLIQEGTIGLMEAAGRFEPDRELRFSTYASWWIRAAMQDYVLRNWSIVRTGTTSAHKSLFFNLKRLRIQLGINDGAPLTQAARVQIAGELKVKEKDVALMEARMMSYDQSLNAPLSDESAAEVQDLMPCKKPTPDEVAAKAIDAPRKSKLIARAMASLTPRESAIIQARRLQDDSKTLSVLGTELGISKERVRQLEKQAMHKLKSAITRDVGEGELAGLMA